VQKRLVGVRSAASHAARHSKLQQERPALQQAVIAASAACDAHKAEVCVLPSSDRNNLLPFVCTASSNRSKSTPLRVHGNAMQCNAMYCCSVFETLMQQIRSHSTLCCIRGRVPSGFRINECMYQWQYQHDRASTVSIYPTSSCELHRKQEQRVS
jgi:hypothetical protein